MVPSPAHAGAPSQGRRLVPQLLLAALLLAGALAVATTGYPAAHAEGQPALAISVKSGNSSQTTYIVVASNFPASQTITETFGDGTLISPASGQTDGSGSMTRFWTLDAATKYCGTITAKGATAQASASFWVALSTDTQSGAACGAGATGGASTTTPDTSSTATTQATTAATAAPTQSPVTQPTVAPANGAGSGDLLHQVLGNRLLLLVAGGAVALFVIVILLLVVVSATRKSGKRGGGPGGQPGTRIGGWNASPNGRQAASGWRVPAQGAPYEPGGRQRVDGQPRPPNRRPDRIQGAGTADPRWRIMDEEHDDQPGVPDQRWSRSQPGARGGHGAGGEGTPPRMRTLGEFTDHKQSVRPPRRGGEGWRR